MQLTLIETEDAYLVVFDNNPDDWVVRFSKSNSFPAREWAERMAKLYNLRAQKKILTRSDGANMDTTAFT